MSLTFGRISILPLAILALVGCTATSRPKSSPLLQPTQMSPNSVALEIFSIRIPASDKELANKVWQEVDEQHFPAELRRRLCKNGFRAGIVGGQVPDSLAKLMALKEKTPSAGEAQQVNVADADPSPRVSLRHLQTRSGQRGEIIASSVYERLPLLLSDSGEIRGQTYSQAQGMFGLIATAQSDGRVQLDLTPELHHDRPQQQWVGDQAMWRLEAGRPKRTFDDMKMSAVLAPGAILLLGSQPDRSGSLGHYFFMEKTGNDGAMEQKVLLIRLCQTQHDDLITPPPLSLGQ